MPNKSPEPMRVVVYSSDVAVGCWLVAHGSAPNVRRLRHIVVIFAAKSITAYHFGVSFNVPTPRTDCGQRGRVTELSAHMASPPIHSHFHRVHLFLFTRHSASNLVSPIASLVTFPNLVTFTTIQAFPTVEHGFICSFISRRLTSRRSQPPLALSVPLSRFTSRVGGGSAFFVRHRGGGFGFAHRDCLVPFRAARIDRVVKTDRQVRCLVRVRVFGRTQTKSRMSLRHRAIFYIPRHCAACQICFSYLYVVNR